MARRSARLWLLDAIGILSYLFQAGAPPAPPQNACGMDPTPDDLGCESFGPCRA